MPCNRRQASLTCVALAAALAAPAEAAYPGKNGRIAFASYRDSGCQVRALFTIRAGGRGLRRLTPACGDAPGPRDPRWSPDGRRILFAANDGEMVMNSDGSNPRPLGLDMFAQATWRPDGRRLAWVEFDGRAPAIYIGPTDASSRRKLARGSAPAWSPDGRRIAFNDPDAGNPPACGGISIADVRTSRVRQLVRGRLAGSGRCLGTPYDADWSPDGGRLVYSGVRGRASDWERALELYSVRADGTGRRRLTDNDALDGRAEWSPDGRFIAFTRERRPGGIGDLWVMRSDGSRERHVLHDATGASWQPLPAR